MRTYIFIALLFLCAQLSAQQEALAKHYFEEGSFEKATGYYEQLYRANPLRIDYLQALVACYQQLERYRDAETLLLAKLTSPYENPVFHIELGYNYTLQNDAQNAEKNYRKALEKIRENPSYTFSIGSTFRKKALLDYALEAYEKGIALSPETNFNLNYHMAAIYGEMGKTEEMFTTYLTLIAQNPSILEVVKRRLGEFIDEDPASDNNLLFKKALLKKNQSDPGTVWNDLLSWLFIQQKQFQSAFTQEKAIYKRSDIPSPERLIQLGLLAREEQEEETAKAIFEFSLKNVMDYDTKLELHRYLLEIEVANAPPEKYRRIEEEFSALFNQYGYKTATIPLQTLYAKFLVFQKNESKKALELLKETLKLPLNPFTEATIKMVLADILVYEENFNQALIYYAQIQKLVKNDMLAQTARFKTAQTSFYKGDFKWAETQLKVLKSSTSQLIANDALQLKLLISDNAYQDSTQTALKTYAKAHLLAYQNKTDEAIALLEQLLTTHKGEPIEDESLLEQARLLENKKEYDKARRNYIKIIEFYPYGILADDALFALAQCYENALREPEKAKEYYEKLIFDHPDSIYFVTARKRYRALRGDNIN